MFDTREEFNEPKKIPNQDKNPNQDSSNNTSFTRSADMVLPNILTVTNISRDVFIGIFDNIGHDAGRSVAGEIYDSILNNEVIDLRSLRETSRYFSDPLSIVWSGEFHFENKMVEHTENSIEICCSNNPYLSPLPYLELNRTGADITLSVHLYRLEDLSWETASDLIDTILPNFSLKSLRERYVTSQEILFEVEEDICVKIGDNLALDCTLITDAESDEEPDLNEISLPRAHDDCMSLQPIAIQLSNPDDKEIGMMLSQVFGSELAQVVSESGLISTMSKFIQPSPTINSRALKRIATQVGISGSLFYCQGGVLSGVEQEEEAAQTLPINREVFFKHKVVGALPVSFVFRPSLYSRSDFVAHDAEAIPPHKATFGIEFLRSEDDTDSEFSSRSWRALMGLSQTLKYWIEEERMTANVAQLRERSKSNQNSTIVEYQHQERINISFKIN